MIDIKIYTRLDEFVHERKTFKTVFNFCVPQIEVERDLWNIFSIPAINARTVHKIRQSP